MEKPTSGSENNPFLAAQTPRLLHDEVVAEGMDHLMRWQNEGGARRLAAYLCRVSHYRLSGDEVDDLVGETVARVLFAIQRGQYVKRENAAFSTFVCTVARHVYFNERRRNAKHLIYSVERDELVETWADPLPAVEAQIETAENLQYLAQGLTVLSPLERRLIEAHYFRGRRWAEIAKEEKKKYASVRQKGSRAIAKLRAHMKKDE
ncbi:MAG: sigma-70 family RNA polymerase sigma factor [Anaerolineae bacterium]|nr:sigma-70 family RNA polymerase sigma factor [Anaerolineae bacterium]